MLWPVVAWLIVMAAPAQAQEQFRRLQPPQYIAALGDPQSSSGSGAQLWGLWRKDPGPRGVRLNGYETLQAAGGLAPALWRFDESDWWLEEHGLIMEKPEFPLAPGRYVVTGGRRVTAILTIHPADTNGEQRWDLDKGTLHDVTHLPCRSARYIPTAENSSCTPAGADPAVFPVEPGATMPAVEGCLKQDYAVLFVVGVGVGN